MHNGVKGLISVMETDRPENHGLSSKSLLAFFAQINQLNLNLNSFILMQNGKATSEFYRDPYRQGNPQLLFSLSKSFTSIAIGIACDEGLLDVSNKVISFFPDKLPHTISDNLAEMTIHHLLSMNAGHHDNIYGSVAEKTDWVKAYLAMEVEHKPGTYYRYSTHSTYMLSAILERVTGQKLIDYLMPHLFVPLGISSPSWETCPLGIVAGGMGLSIPTEGIAKFGQMLLNKGVFNGHRIVSDQYILLATSEQSDTSRDEERIDFSQGYGYQFFMCRDGCFMGNGGYGQLCFVSPKHQVVIAATSSFSSMKQLQTLLDLVYDHILLPLDTDILFDHVEQKAELDQHLSNMTFPYTTPRSEPNHTICLNDLHFSFMDNTQMLTQLHFTSSGSEFQFKLIFDDQSVKTYPFNFNSLIHSTDHFTKDLATHDQEVVTQACWIDSYQLSLTLIYIETPYVVIYFVRFYDNKIELKYTNNMSFGFDEYELIGVQV
ncbi:serine hydrolase domain-containing protein [Bacillus sp. FJAT-28004]|uniref:serine hydrolase domain-containing protein n=1 Tax=Bacillus sp. FJAT-28004 TaxID=1679165 RepID=UPI0009EB4DE9|nr:serine hydrolase [Bacillus sp. FJAT-28004]